MCLQICINNKASLTKIYTLDWNVSLWSLSLQTRTPFYSFFSFLSFFFSPIHLHMRLVAFCTAFPLLTCCDFFLDSSLYELFYVHCHWWFLMMSLLKARAWIRGLLKGHIDLSLVPVIAQQTCLPSGLNTASWSQLMLQRRLTTLTG